MSGDAPFVQPQRLGSTTSYSTPVDGVGAHSSAPTLSQRERSTCLWRVGVREARDPSVTMVCLVSTSETQAERREQETRRGDGQHAELEAHQPAS